MTDEEIYQPNAKDKVCVACHYVCADETKDYPATSFHCMKANPFSFNAVSGWQRSIPDCRDERTLGQCGLTGKFFKARED